MTVPADAIPQGGSYDITVDQGASWSRVVGLRGPDGTTPINLTGWSARAQVHTRPGNTLMATITATVDAVAGDIALSMTPTVTRGIVRTGVWSLEVYTAGDADVVSIISKGTVLVNREITA